MSFTQVYDQLVARGVPPAYVLHVLLIADGARDLPTLAAKLQKSERQVRRDLAMIAPFIVWDGTRTGHICLRSGVTPMDNDNAASAAAVEENPHTVVIPFHPIHRDHEEPRAERAREETAVTPLAPETDVSPQPAHPEDKPVLSSALQSIVMESWFGGFTREQKREVIRVLAEVERDWSARYGLDYSRLREVVEGAAILTWAKVLQGLVTSPVGYFEQTLRNMIREGWRKGQMYKGRSRLYLAGRKLA